MISVRSDPVAALGGSDIAAMHGLLARHFTGVDPRQVADDLAGKDAVVRLFAAGELAGFSTIAYARVPWQDGEIGAVWSGDTIVDPSCWHVSALPAAWLTAVKRLHAGRGRLAWCLICSGVRTYRYMPTFASRFAPLDAGLLGLRDHLARWRYGAAYAEGIVRLPRPQVLRPHLATTPTRLDHEAEPFVRLNPGHAAGDELACATWLEPSSLTRLGRRLWERCT